MLEYAQRTSQMPKYQPGDYIKVEFKDESDPIGEWMWVIVDRADDEHRLVFGRLDNESILDGRLRPGQELAISYDKIREHKREGEFLSSQ